jgi:predicted TIM-barrel fold metal-dependent hydrolase
MTRRRFLGGMAAGAIAVGAAARRSSPAATGEGPGKALPPGRFVDAHTHIGRTWNHTQELTASKLLEWMDARAVSQAFVLPLASPESSSFLLTTEFVLAETKPHRDRLIPFCAIDPRTSYSGGARGLLDMLKTYAGRGAKGFGEHKPGVRIDDPRSMLLYEACGELGLPVLFHLDGERNMDEPGLPGLERALGAFPRTTFIGHGPGWWASISGDARAADLAGYPKGPVAPGGAIDRLMDRHANIFGELSAGSGAGALERDPKFAREFLVRRADRLLFGTDYLAPGQEVRQFEVLARLGLPPEVEEKVYRGNARRLVGIG